jgi:TolB protein
MRLSVYWCALCLLLLSGLVGCSTTRQITVSTHPPDALIRIDGADSGKGQVTQNIVFKGDKDTHTVTVSRLGYQEQSVPLQKSFAGDVLNVALKPLTRKVTINVTPVPAMISIDGQPATSAPSDSVSQTLEFTVDAQNKWTTHTAVAKHPGFSPAMQVITWQDTDPNYTLHQEPQKKDLTIITRPAGAQVFLDGEPLGKSPVTVKDHPFPIDLASGQTVPQKLRIVKNGYDPIEQTISWDGGKSDYDIALAARSKSVRFITTPPGADVSIEGKPIPRGDDGIATALVQFPPINDKGDLPAYQVKVTKKTADREWYPQTLTLGWDAGKTDYTVHLKEITTRQVPLLSADFQRVDVAGQGGWEVRPLVTQTLAMKQTSEGESRQPPQRISLPPAGSQLDTLSVSPDGTRLLYTLLAGKTPAEFHSQILMIRTDGSGGSQYLTDGRSLEITPAFTPGGDQIVFSSNRAGKHMSVWQMSAAGAPGITQLTRGDTNDLWPSIDSDPKPRLYYQALVDTRPDSRIYMTQLGTTTLTDLLTQMGGTQPRVSPKADTVLFTAVNDKTGKRDIYIMPDTGGAPRNLTNTPDVDEFDPAWNRDGNRIAFVSDAGFDSEHRKNLNIWTMDLNRPQHPMQVTTNGSYDDHPQWDPSGSAIYFRSNRGGQWAIWKTAVGR